MAGGEIDWEKNGKQKKTLELMNTNIQEAIKKSNDLASHPQDDIQNSLIKATKVEDIKTVVDLDNKIQELEKLSKKFDNNDVPESYARSTRVRNTTYHEIEKAKTELKGIQKRVDPNNAQLTAERKKGQQAQGKADKKGSSKNAKADKTKQRESLESKNKEGRSSTAEESKLPFKNKTKGQSAQKLTPNSLKKKYNKITPEIKKEALKIIKETGLEDALEGKNIDLQKGKNIKKEANKFRKKSSGRGR